MKSRRVALVSALCFSLTVAAPLGLQPAMATNEPTLVFATWNVCKVDCAPPAPSWDVRRERVGRVVAESGVDVLGLQEVTNNPTSMAPTQVDDVRQLLAPQGLVQPVFPNEANECRRPRDAAGQLSGPSPCDNTSALFYRASTVAQAESRNGLPTAGIVQVGSIAPGSSPEAARRSVAWAYLEGRNGTGPFLAISLHATTLKTGQAERDRQALGGALRGWAESWNTQRGFAGAPVILMADLNSFAKRQPRGVQRVLTNSGWQDAFAAPVRSNVQYSSINYSVTSRSEAGFPARPFVTRKTKRNPKAEATRIDYIMALGNTVRFTNYEVVIRLNPNGTFIPDYQASDHQMIRATVAFAK